MEPTAISSKQRDLGQAAIALALFFAALAVYLLTFSGRFSTVDELALYATTESLAQQGSLARPMLSFAWYHNPVGRIEPLYSALAVPFYSIGSRLSAVSTVHVVMLLNPLLTALTVAGIFWALRRLGYGNTASVLPAGAFAFATLAWPYARSFLREPLVGLLWVAGFLALIAWRQSRHARWLVLAAVALLLSVLTKLVAAVGIVAFGIAIVSDMPIRRMGRLKLALILVGVLGAAVGLIVVLGATRRQGILWFVPILAKVHPLDLLINAYGFLLSPGKGLFVYSPVLLASLFGVRGFLRKNRVEAWAAFGLILGTLVTYFINPQKYAGQIWGPRYLLPAIPFMVMPLAEVVERGAVWARVTVAALGVTSLVVQLPAAVGDWLAYREWLLKIDPTPEIGIGLNPLRFDLSPVWLQFSRWRAENLNLLWLHRTPESGAWLLDRPLALLLIGAAALAFVTLIATVAARRRATRFLIAPAIALTAAVVLGAGVALMAAGPRDEPGYYGLSPDEAQAIGALASHDGEPYLFALASNEIHNYPMLGYLKGKFVTHWVSPSQTDGFDEFLSPGIAAPRLVLVIDWVHRTADQPLYALGTWLNQHYYRYRTEWIGGYEIWTYATAGPELVVYETPDTLWGNAMGLESYAVQAGAVETGEPLRLEFHFRALGRVTYDYVLFVHLVAPSGEVFPGEDAPPQLGAAPTRRWKQGELIVDKRGFLIPEDLAPGDYTLIAGFVGPDGRRAWLRSGSAPHTDHLVLGTIRVTGP